MVLHEPLSSKRIFEKWQSNLNPSRTFESLSIKRIFITCSLVQREITRKNYQRLRPVFWDIEMGYVGIFDIVGMEFKKRIISSFTRQGWDTFRLF